MKSNSNVLLWNQTVGRNLHEDKVIETVVRCISTFCVICYSFVPELTWQWLEVMERVFRGRAHQYEPFDCFKLSGRMTLDDFGRDLMRGTIGEQVVGELWTLWMNGFTFFSLTILYFMFCWVFAHHVCHGQQPLKHLSFWRKSISGTCPCEPAGWSVTHSNSSSAAAEHPSGAILDTCDLWDTW